MMRSYSVRSLVLVGAVGACTAVAGSSAAAEHTAGCPMGGAPVAGGVAERGCPPITIDVPPTTVVIPRVSYETRTFCAPNMVAGGGLFAPGLVPPVFPRLDLMSPLGAGIGAPLGAAIGAPFAATMGEPVVNVPPVTELIPSGEAAQPAPAPQEQPTAAPVEQAQAAPAAYEGATEAPATATDDHGPVQLIEEALSGICLEPAQREKIQALGKHVEQEHAGVVEARGDLMNAIAEQIASDCFDRNALEDEIAALVVAHGTAGRAVRSALAELHAILTPDQRGQFVDSLEKGIEDRLNRFREGGWQDQIVKDLGLTEDQKSQLRDVFAKAQPAVERARATGKEMADAFRGDCFNPEEILPASEAQAHALARAKGMVDLSEELVSILTPEQRAKVAENIAERRQSRAAPTGQCQ